ncbi:Htaa protein [Corynebacterium spheniscorum]|uniref:Htaa protein n=1 Tax=Corynebacterium spheniscorum TaxID=185761 RepID=A0A1I2RZY5_9CORY|nr:HtaA domain-containing protein [Corynebacterium spheniscorum]SFG46122.1 Htaa protein [Corynebacterium spheniscorum]
MTFPVASASNDVISFTGGMHVVMPQVDSTITDLKILLNGTTAQLQDDYTATTAAGTTSGDDVILADITLFEPESTTHTVGFGNSTTVLTTEGSQAFGGAFAAGQQVMPFDAHGAWCGGDAGQPVVPAPTPAPETSTEETTTEATPTEEATPDLGNHKRGPVYAAFYKLLHFLARIFNGVFGGIFQIFGGLFR